jgi:muramoyltetrapeptide carboxypeptidase
MVTFPAALRPGDLIAVVAPSGPLPRDELWRGLAWVRDRYRVRMSSGVLEHAGDLAGDDARRARELDAALGDREVKAIVAGRGGYGAMRLLNGLEIVRAGCAPRWIVGFSDVTALHVIAAKAGVASIHGPNVTGLGRTSPENRAAWLAALERPTARQRWSGLEALSRGAATGQACGGNLALVEAMAAAGRPAVRSGGILFLEDVDERPYRIDRMLTSLRLGGHLARAAGIVFGGFSRCPPGKDGVTVEQVLVERTRGLGIPVLAGAPFGHGDDNRAFVLGREVAIEGTSVVFC